MDVKKSPDRIDAVGGNPPGVKRYENAEGLEYDSDEVYSTTCHETAHLTHARRVGLAAYLIAGNVIRESWCVAVEWWLTGIEYRERGIANYGSETYDVETGFPNQFAYQFWNPGILQNNVGENYTSLFINLIDVFNERGQPFSGGRPDGTVDDRLGGYTISGIEDDILTNVYGFGSLDNALKNHKPVGVTDQDIDVLLSFYN